MIDLKSFLLSFKYAFEGIWFCISTQRNFRFHTAAALTAWLLSLKYDFSGNEKIILCFTIAFVLISEMINTAVEAIVDMTCKEYNKNAKIAKDVCAASVFVSAIAAVITALVLFYDNGRFWYIMLDYIKNPLFWVYTAVCLFYIFGFNLIFGGKTGDK